MFFYRLIIVYFIFMSHSVFAKDATNEKKVSKKETSSQEGKEPKTEKDKNKGFRIDTSVSVPRFLSNKLRITADLGFTKISYKGIDWRSSGGAGVGILYYLPKLMKETFVTFSYMSADVSPRKGSGESFREYIGVLEAYQIGSMYKYKINKTVELLGGGNLGLFFATYKGVSHPEEKDSLPSSGAFFNLAAEAHFKLLEKLYLGSKINLGFGTLQVYQVMANVVFSL